MPDIRFRVDGKGAMLASVHWTLERVMSIVTLAAVPVAFWASHPVTDSILALVTVIHTHWGLEVRASMNSSAHVMLC